MIRADLFKGAKRLSNFIDRDASPRKDDQGKFHSHKDFLHFLTHDSPPGLVIDHGNVGFIPNVDGQHPLGGRFSFPSFPAANSQASIHESFVDPTSD